MHSISVDSLNREALPEQSYASVRGICRSPRTRVRCGYGRRNPDEHRFPKRASLAGQHPQGQLRWKDRPGRSCVGRAPLLDGNRTIQGISHTKVVKYAKLRSMDGGTDPFVEARLARAVAHPTRRAILELLMGEKGVSPTALGEKLEVKVANACYHLEVPRRLRCRRSGAGGRARRAAVPLAAARFQGQEELARRHRLDARGRLRGAAEEPDRNDLGFPPGLRPRFVTTRAARSGCAAAGRSRRGR